jgi:hypothetical protein
VYKRPIFKNKRKILSLLYFVWIFQDCKKYFFAVAILEEFCAELTFDEVCAQELSVHHNKPYRLCR